MHIDFLQDFLNEFTIEHKLWQRKVFLFGSNGYVKDLRRMLENNGVKILGIVDNDKKKQGTVKNGLPVLSLDYANELGRGEEYFIILSKYWREMSAQLIRAGRQKLSSFVVMNDIFRVKHDEFLVSNIERGWNIYTQLTAEYGENNYFLLLEMNTLGDPYIFGGLLQEYIQIKHISNYVFILCKTNMEAFINNCGAKNTKILSSDEANALVSLHRLMGDKINLILLHKTKELPWRVCSARQMNFLRTIRVLLDLPPSSKHRIPQAFFSKDMSGKYVNLRESGVLLLPKANTLNELDGAFWNEIIKRLKELSITVYCNVAPGENPLKDTIPLSISTEDAVTVCDAIGCVIAARSGFCDLISSSNCEKIVLFNNTRLYSNHISEFDFYSIRKCWGVDAKEIIVSGNISEDIDRILAYMMCAGV